MKWTSCGQRGVKYFVQLGWFVDGHKLNPCYYQNEKSSIRLNTFTLVHFVACSHYSAQRCTSVPTYSKLEDTVIDVMKADSFENFISSSLLELLHSICMFSLFLSLYNDRISNSTKWKKSHDKSEWALVWNLGMKLVVQLDCWLLLWMRRG